MRNLPYKTFVIDVSQAAGAGGLIDGAKKEILPPGIGISAVLIRRLTPVSQIINLHFGTTSDPIPVYQGEIFDDRQMGPLEDPFNGGLYWSYNGAPAANTQLVLTIFTTGGSA